MVEIMYAIHMKYIKSWQVNSTGRQHPWKIYPVSKIYSLEITIPLLRIKKRGIKNIFEKCISKLSLRWPKVPKLELGFKICMSTGGLLTVSHLKPDKMGGYESRQLSG